MSQEGERYDFSKYKEKIKDFVRFYTTKPFTPSKILGLAIIIILILAFVFVLLLVIGIITPLSLANFVINLVGEDVEVTDIKDPETFSEHLGMRILDADWELISEMEDRAFLKNGTASIAITYIEADLEDEETYLTERINEMTRELDKAGVFYFTQESTVCGHPVTSLISEADSKFMTSIWYCDVTARIYIVSSLYEDRNDVHDFMLMLECHQLEGTD